VKKVNQSYVFRYHIWFVHYGTELFYKSLLDSHLI